mmetsp:Transcript_13464/g.20122  ORF Transcript_13464/g.20122 Transcript_13464/m.20122 type:complete len:173 (-) Transcript_13464:140-658(-)
MMMTTRPPPGDLLTYAYSLALAESKAKEDAYRRTSSINMEPISEEGKPSDDSSSDVASAAITEDSRKELALQRLLKIVDDNKIIIDDRLRRVIAGQDETYTSTDAVESIRRSSSSGSSISSDGRRRRHSTNKGSLIHRSRRQLGSLFRKSSSRSDGEKESTGDTDSSISSHR